MSRRSSELREYHESPPAIVRDMEEWLAVGDRRAAAESVRRWLVESYELAPANTASEPRVRRAPSRGRRVASANKR